MKPGALPAGEDAALLQGYLAVGDGGIEVLHAEGEERFARDALTTLAGALPSIGGYFRLEGPFPKVRGALVPSRDEFDRLVRDFLRVAIEVPSNPGRIAQAQRTDMVILSPSAYERDSVHRYAPDDFQRLLAHELVHIVEEHLSPDIEAVPRWWSEGLAVHLSGEWRGEEACRGPVREGISRGTIPGFREIAASTKLAYAWGWTVVRFVEDAYGEEAVPRIVRECAGGDVFSPVGEEAEDVEKAWREWLPRCGAGFDPVGRSPRRP